jgi:hypothetical protein
VRKEGKLVVDIIDPHSISLSDAPAKAGWQNLPACMLTNSAIELVMLDGSASKRLDLTDEVVRNRVKGIKLPEQLRRLFTETKRQQHSGIDCGAV